MALNLFLHLPMPSRNNHTKYHSSIPLFYIQKMEHLLPKELRDKIPNSTISTWRSSATESYFGYEYEYITKEAIGNYELMLKSKI